jgi:hypothetical protein
MEDDRLHFLPGVLADSVMGTAIGIIMIMADYVTFNQCSVDMNTIQQ